MVFGIKRVIIFYIIIEFTIDGDAYKFSTIVDLSKSYVTGLRCNFGPNDDKNTGAHKS